MNRNKLKNYAPQARRDFIKAVTDRAAYYGLTREDSEPITEQGDMAIIAGKPFPRSVAAKRKRLEERIRRQGFDQVMEAMAYTWFNRFVAIRYMELHGYLDHGYRVLSTASNTNNTIDIPDVLKYAEHVDLMGLDREKVIELKLAGDKDEELYRMLLIAQCNALHNAMPFLFEKVDHETELLLPENLLHSDSLIRKLVNEIPEDEWQEVEIIGWLYQFYISEKKDQVIGKVIKSEDISAATQLFTPNWIVKYMVQNTLGRQWVASYPHSSLKGKMDYYIEPAEQRPEVQEKLKAITPDSLNPEELTLLDPACGSGHILVETYDLLKTIYQERGYRAKDIPRLILEKNLYGLEIDDRAAQLAAFALMMKARADDRRIFDNGTRPYVLATQESKGMDVEKITEALNAPILKGDPPPREMLFEEMDEARAPLFSRKNLSVKGDISRADVAQLIWLFEHAKTFGSLIRVPEGLAEKLPVIAARVADMLAYGNMFGKVTAEALKPIVSQARILAGKYDAVVTNPPYMGGNGMNPTLKEFAKDQFPNSKTDLFAMFIERNIDYAFQQGTVGMITMQSWMFLSSFEKLRESILSGNTILSMSHLGARAFDSIGGEVVSTTAFVLGNAHYPEYKGGYFRLVDGNSETEKDGSLREAINDPDCGWFYRASAADLTKIPGNPIAYWASKKLLKAFIENPALGEAIDTAQGMKTLDNEGFIRKWFEVSFMRTSMREPSDSKWFPINHGGDYRKWYGNNDSLINWKKDGEEIKALAKEKYNSVTRTVTGMGHYFDEGITWTAISSNRFCVRRFPKGFLFTNAGMCAFSNTHTLDLACCYLNTKVTLSILEFLSPTLNFGPNQVKLIPFVENEALSDFSKVQFPLIFELSQSDWDSYETSWDFTSLPLLKRDHRQPTLEATYAALRTHWHEMTMEMQRLEEENNRIFIEAYGLQDELTPDVPLEEITLTCNPRYRYGGNKSEEDLEEFLLADTMKELISYAVGCMMGRYSLDAPGLTYAHSGNKQFWEINHQKHGKQPQVPAENNRSHLWSSFPPDEDGIIPITDTDWFEDDAANRVLQFISVAWPKAHMEENLKFMAGSLGPSRDESPRDTIRRYLATGFYKHHMKIYKNRPIYWLFASGKQRAFQCLVYLHRYNSATLSRMRTEYVIPLQGKINARIDQLNEDAKAASSTPYRKKVERERDKLVKQQTELQAFDEKLRHYADQRISLDLDDGVKVNYGKFGGLLAEVQAVTGRRPE